MSTLSLYFLAFIGGVSLAIQGGFNAQLGVSLRNPFLATLVAYGVSTFFAVSYIIIDTKPLPVKETVMAVPYHLWIIGGFFSVIGLSLYYYIIPHIGISKVLTFGLSGQMIFGLIAGYFGWFNLPEEVLSIQKIMGLIFMLISIILLAL